MEVQLYIGMVMGSLYFITKLGLFWLITKPMPSVRRWIHRTALAQAVLDCVFGYLGMHVFTLAGGSILSMIAMITFAVCSMTYIFTHVVTHKIRRMFDGYRKPNIQRSNVGSYSYHI